MARPGDDPSADENASIKERLRALDVQLRAARGQPLPETADRRGSAMAAAFRITAELVAGVIVGAFIGWALDAWLGTGPLFLVLFFFLGSAAGILNVMRSARNMQLGSAPENGNRTRRDGE